MEFIITPATKEQINIQKIYDYSIIVNIENRIVCNLFDMETIVFEINFHGSQIKILQ